MRICVCRALVFFKYPEFVKVTEMEETKNKERKIKILSAVIFAIICIGLTFFLFSGGNLDIIRTVLREDMSKDEVRDTLDNFGIKGYITIGILSMLQVVLTFLPAEPVQVLAGIAYGFLRGGLICLLGVFVGNTVIYILYKNYGQRLTAWFKSNVEFDFDLASKSLKVGAVILILYFLPAIPYGLICFFAASLNFKYPKYILLTVLGSIPSIAIGVGLGHMAIASSWIISVSVFVVLVILLIILNKNKATLFKKLNEYMKKSKSSASAARKPDGLLLDFATLCTKVFLFGKVKIKFKNNVGRLERPCIVLANHGAFLDFAYAGRIIRKERPSFIIARLYTYHKTLGKIIRRAGAFPKSMFSTDLENAKNCIRVIRNNGVLIMMPEARLSTVGKWEGVQEVTYQFIKKTGLPVYTIKLEGNYFAKPKWGDKVRGGSVVYSTLNLLYTKEQIAELSAQEIQAGVESVLKYDEFEWLKTQPDIHYKSKTLAKGLENILVRCPHCGAKYSMITEGMTVKCSECEKSATLNDRYAFVDNTPFENFAEWYDWQRVEMEKEILTNPEFKLEQNVTLKHSSKDGKTMLRVAGTGVCTLDKTGLTYRGERDGESIEKHFPLSVIYRLLFGSGENFEIYEGREIWFFVPDEIRSCVDFYIASEFLKKHYDN